MNILIVSHEYPPIGGGGANACLYLAKNYAELGHRVTILTACFRELPQEEEKGNVHIIRVRALRKKEDKSTFLEMFTFLCSAWLKVGRIVRKEKYDVCQIFFGIPSGPIGLYLKKRYDIPYVIRFGGGDIPGAQKRFSFIYKLLSPAIHSIWKNADALVANSTALRQKALQFESKYAIDIISNGVDSDFFTRTKAEAKLGMGASDKQVNVLFVSRLIQGKGLQYIIPEMKRINNACGRKVQLTIVGDGPYRGELERITSESDAEAYVSFEGKKGKKELFEYYSKADLFILPSESEGMPNVVLEAMAMGLPILITPCGGSKELIADNGRIESIERFVPALIEMCNNEQGCIDMGRQSELRARMKFGWRERAKEYIALFGNISIQSMGSDLHSVD